MTKTIKQWKPSRITLQPGQVYTYNTLSEQTNIFQIVNRIAAGGGTVFVDTESNVSATSYQLRVDQGSSQNLILPYTAKVIYLKTDSAVPLTVSIVEIASDDISFVFGAAQLVNISGNVQVQQPVTVAGTVGISGNVEVMNDVGNPLPVSGTVGVNNFPATQAVSGTVNIGTIPEVEIKNDTGNGLPVNPRTAGTLTDRSGTITLGGTAQQAAAANASRKYLFLQNVSAADLWFNLGVTAVVAQPSIKLAAGEKMDFTDFIPTDLVSVIGGTTGQAFTIKEG